MTKEEALARLAESRQALPQAIAGPGEEEMSRNSIRLPRQSGGNLPC